MAVLAIDFDNTMVKGDKALEGLKVAINTLREKGHKIVIHSCNNKPWIERTLNNLDIRFDFIWDQVGKPICDLYIDDKGYHFPYNGSWLEELPKVLARVEGLDNRKLGLKEPQSIAHFASGLQLEDEYDG